jgi:hypothetical protein
VEQPECRVQQLPVSPLETLHNDIVPGNRTLSRQTRLYLATFFSRLLEPRKKRALPLIVVLCADNRSLTDGCLS